MSFKYTVLKSIIKALGIKRMWDLPADKIVAKRKKANARMKIPKLHDRALEIDTVLIDGFPVMRMLQKSGSSRADLNIIGGGMIMPPSTGDLKKTVLIAKETGLDIYVPFYPLCTDYPLNRAYEMIHAVYTAMLERYAPEDISVLGTSSGGNLALGLVAYINANKLGTPIPGHIIAISPGTCVADEEEWRRMQELDRKDFLISAQYMKTAEEIMRCGSDCVPDYMVFLQKGDFTNCPRVTFIYGSDEVLYAVARSFEAAMKRYGVKYNMIVGQGMFHCYPAFPVVKEAKEGWRQMIRIMKA